MRKLVVVLIFIVAITATYLVIHTKGTEPAKESSPSPFTSFVADGSFSDWEGIQPVWSSGYANPDPWPFQEIWFQSVYTAKDSENLYFFIVHEPNLPERFSTDQMSGCLGWIYADIDADVNTGSTSGLGFMGHEEAKGFELALWLPLGVEASYDMTTQKVRAQCYICCELYLLDQGLKFASSPTHSYTSLESKPLIAYSREGVEICVPLSYMPRPVDPNMRLAAGEELASWKDRWNDGKVHAPVFVQTREKNALEEPDKAK
ncbi:MAG: hypothetical protein ACYTBP_08945 [Planctomycetota bacterium]|jgi:hypothetical protein